MMTVVQRVVNFTGRRDVKKKKERKTKIVGRRIFARK